MSDQPGATVRAQNIALFRRASELLVQVSPSEPWSDRLSELLTQGGGSTEQLQSGLQAGATRFYDAPKLRAFLETRIGLLGARPGNEQNIYVPSYRARQVLQWSRIAALSNLLPTFDRASDKLPLLGALLNYVVPREAVTNPNSDPPTAPAATVTIIGGGVTGLTAAHELADRGFKVQVVEKRGSWRIQSGVHAVCDVAVGGLAATQTCGYSRVQAPGGSSSECEDNPDLLDATVIATVTVNSVDSVEIKRSVQERIDDLGWTAAAGTPLYFACSANADPLAVQAVVGVLEAATILNYKLIHVKDLLPPRGALKPGAESIVFVHLFRHEARLPGEHGYRFFPSFYRHIFDTMQRTPLYDEQGMETGQTAYDNLVPTYTQVFAGAANSVPFTRARPTGIEGFRREFHRLVTDLGFDRRDVVRFSLRMLRYLTSCKARRTTYEALSWLEFVRRREVADAESDLLPYSDAFLEQLRAAPQALVAMDAEQCDARTQGTILVQLMLDQFVDRGPRTDSTLNGPTTEAWLTPWRRHLEALGVQFFRGQLKTLAVGKDEKLEVRWTVASQDCWITIKHARDVYKLLKEGSTDNESPVIASLDAANNFLETWPTEEVKFREKYTADWTDDTWTTLQIALDRLMGAATTLGKEDLKKKAQEVMATVKQLGLGRPTPCARRSEEPRDYVAPDYYILATDIMTANDCLDESIKEKFRPVPSSEEAKAKQLSAETVVGGLSRFVEPGSKHLKVFTGVQFYFPYDLELGRGHVYFPDSDWGLSAISQLQFWRHRNRWREHDLRGILSVDVGDMYADSEYLNREALRCKTKRIFADEVWRQVRTSLRRSRDRLRQLDSTLLPVPEPVAFHVDMYLTEDDGADGTRGLKADPTSLFLVNLTGAWELRPGPEPFDPQHPMLADGRLAGPHVSQAGHGGYQVYFDQLVFAGTYLRTFTRMTTMESANESARHAVNAILDHMTSRQSPLPSVQRSNATVLVDALHLGLTDVQHEEMVQDLLKTGVPLGDMRLPRISGDYCKIWDPERHELDALDFFRRVDEEMMVRRPEAGSPTPPHMFDILGLERAFEDATEDIDPLTALMLAFAETTRTDWAIEAKELLGTGGAPARAIQRLIEKLLGAGKSELVKIFQKLKS